MRSCRLRTLLTWIHSIIRDAYVSPPWRPDRIPFIIPFMHQKRVRRISPSTMTSGLTCGFELQIVPRIQFSWLGTYQGVCMNTLIPSSIYIHLILVLAIASTTLAQIPNSTSFQDLTSYLPFASINAAYVANDTHASTQIANAAAIPVTIFLTLDVPTLHAVYC